MDRLTLTEVKDMPLVLSRIVPVRREGNKVYMRTLRYGEEDSGEVVHLQAGDEPIIEAGDLTIDSREVDAQSEPGFRGYAPVANTVYVWCHIVREQVSFYLFFFSLARRLDAAHALWASAVQEREKAKAAASIQGRISYLNALATAEVAIIALHRALSMVTTLVNEYCTDLHSPDSVQRITTPVAAMRSAFEHIDERAQGKVGWSRKADIDALTIFDQTDFIESSTLRYRNHSFDFEADILPALMDSRELIVNAIDSRASAQATE